MFYFAYGSNMLTERLRDRVPSAEPVTTVHLPGYDLRFHKRSRDGSAKGNVIEDDESTSVHGVLFSVATDDLSALDQAENRGYGYERCRVHPRTDGESVEAFTYIAQPAYVDDAHRPYGWYKAVVAAGTIQHDLPPFYRTRIKAIRSYPDPNEDRRARYESLLHSAGYPHAWPDR
jgi:hypothetical protein